MTKREICEKEMGVLWNALLEADGGANDTMMSIASVMKELILDLAAPDDHFADLGKKGATLPDISVSAPEEEKPKAEAVKSALQPPVLIYEENGEKVPCPACGALAYIIKNAPKIYCKRCAKFYTREEDAK